MGIRFWLVRFLLFFAGAFIVLTIAEVIKGSDLAQAGLHGIIWAPISAAIYATVAYVRVRQCRLRQQQ